MSPEKMIIMANQIATFFNTQPGDAPENIATHLSDFWEPRMRRQLLDYIDSGGDGLSPSVQKAAEFL